MSAYACCSKPKLLAACGAMYVCMHAHEVLVNEISYKISLKQYMYACTPSVEREKQRCAGEFVCILGENIQCKATFITMAWLLVSCCCCHC